MGLVFQIRPKPRSRKSLLTPSFGLDELVGFATDSVADATVLQVSADGFVIPYNLADGCLTAVGGKERVTDHQPCSARS